MNLRSNLNHRVSPPRRGQRSGSAGRNNLLAALEESEKLAKAGESSFRAANHVGLHIDQRAVRRAHIVYDQHAASRAGVHTSDAESCFHVLSFHPFTQRGLTYPTVHHFVMAERFQGTPIAEEIPQAASLWELDRLVQIGERNGWERKDWNLVRLNTLIIGNFLKFRQNAEIMKTLIRTKQRAIVVELPDHYKNWVAHEKVHVKKKDDDDSGLVNGSPASARLPPINAAFAARIAGGSKAAEEEKEEATTTITGSTHKNLGGAVLMSLRKKLAIAFQADEKQRIKERQMQILKQQMEEKAAREKKREEERKKKEEEKAERERLKAEASPRGSVRSSSTRRVARR